MAVMIIKKTLSTKPDPHDDIIRMSSSGESDGYEMASHPYQFNHLIPSFNPLPIPPEEPMF